MGLLKKRNRIVPQGALSQWINSYVDQKQRKLADYLNARTRHVTGIAMLYGLIIFCAVSGSYLLYLLASAFGAFN